MAPDSTDELEKFRLQWQQEVTARSRGSTSNTDPRRASSPNAQRYTATADDSIDRSRLYGHHSLQGRNDNGDLVKASAVREASGRQEPISALEHYERAVEREDEGSLGDSLGHYRAAFRLDAGVDRLYRNKHFPTSSTSKPPQPNPSNAPATVPNPAHHSLDGPPGTFQASSVSQLIASFSSVSITPEEPPTDHSPPPPCPIAAIPSEILIGILLQTALTDIASFARLSLVCKRLAYLVATEDRIWRRICLGPEYGFKAMHYTWAVTILGGPLPTTIASLDVSLTSATLSPPILSHLPLSPTYPTYKEMFRARPRIRFNGCYISTVNYIRPGASTPSQASWNSPVLIVTYYRYLRFFRDGSCLSLLTTTEPADVVPHLLKENLHARHAAGLPSAVMNHAVRGRWKLSGDPYRPPNPLTTPTTTPTTTNTPPSSSSTTPPEGTLHIETEGADADKPNPKYVYKMQLQMMKSGGRGGGGGKKEGAGAGVVGGAVRNNKLAWGGYWSWNRLTDDWAEFGLRNDRPFFWSRVRSWEGG